MDLISSRGAGGRSVRSSTRIALERGDCQEPVGQCIVCRLDMTAGIRRPPVSKTHSLEAITALLAEIKSGRMRLMLHRAGRPVSCPFTGPDRGTAIEANILGIIAKSRVASIGLLAICYANCLKSPKLLALLSIYHRRQPVPGSGALSLLSKEQRPAMTPSHAPTFVRTAVNEYWLNRIGRDHKSRHRAC